jgi:predicted N-acetyltransferase YhbS
MISVASLSDARALTALRTAVARGMTEKFGEGHWSASPTKADVVRQIRASRVLVARADAGIVGTVRLITARPWAIDSSCFTLVTKPLYVLGLAVSPEHRDKGVGRHLMDAAKDTARSLHAEALWLDAYEHSAGAGPFYMKCGFRKVGSTKYREMPLSYYEWLVPRKIAGAQIGTLGAI